MPTGKLAALFVFTLLACSAMSAQSSPGPSKHSGPPIVGEFQPPQESPEDFGRRQTRERRYGNLRTPGRIFDPGEFVKGYSETTHATFLDYAVIGQSSDPYGIPASVSTAIVIATVMSGQCFVTSDHGFVYTDYQLKIDAVLKADPSADLKPGVLVTGARAGGAVHFPSGHKTKYVYRGYGFPTIGSRYVLFLRRDIPDLPEYEIIFASGYEIKTDRVYSLDDMNVQYDDMSFPIFVSTVRQAIATSQNQGVKP
jgi:hypothetical protein